MDSIQLFFIHWVMTYNDVLTEMLPEDRNQALKHIENDHAFDQWLKRYVDKQNRNSASKSKGTPVSKEEFFQKTSGRMPKPGAN